MTEQQKLPDIRELHAQLMAGLSATRTLGDWCRLRGMTDPTILARRIAAPPRAASAAQRRRLGVDADEPLGYRRVALMCGAHVLVEADNWYVPGRLTANMRFQLETSDIPFGLLVAPLATVRQTLRADLSPDGDPLMRVHALVMAGETPLAEVEESYRRELLAPPDSVPEVR